jgi:sugar lactone lactonase YvrE
MQELSARPFVELGSFGEAPRWRDGKLWVSVLTEGRVASVDLDGKIETVCEVPTPLGIEWLPDGRLLVVSAFEYRVYAFDGQALEPYCDLSAHCAGPPNDIVVDAQGRAYVGNMGSKKFLEGEPPRPADLVMIDADGTPSAAAPDLLFANGMAITPDGGTLIVAETFAECLTAFDVDPRDGSLSGRRVFASLEGRTPDGIALDREGAVWTASMESGEFLRVLEGGEITHRIAPPDRNTPACALGGPDRRTLFLITLEKPHEIETVPEAIQRGLMRARIETAEAPVAGVG